MGRRLGGRERQCADEHRRHEDPGRLRWRAKSPCGCEDLAGNVWEWTRSLWGTDWNKPDFGYPYDANDRLREDPDAPDNVWRVVRGGSWYSRRGVARCGIRSGDRPSGRNGGFGFRVVLRSPPVLPL
ncbi:MAG: SUMF1/EgtB/PvdO family nonheme iron enzyme [Accumulibacter sp.]